MIFKKKWILAIILTLAISQSRPTSATVISNLNVIFETFGPLSMVRFFEFNDVGWNISEKCIKDMFLLLGNATLNPTLYSSKLITIYFSSTTSHHSRRITQGHPVGSEVYVKRFLFHSMFL